LGSAFVWAGVRLTAPRPSPLGLTSSHRGNEGIRASLIVYLKFFLQKIFRDSQKNLGRKISSSNSPSKSGSKNIFNYVTSVFRSTILFVLLKRLA
jgi:hypothetical protein